MRAAHLNLHVTTLDYEEFLQDAQLKQKIEEGAKNDPANHKFNLTRFKEDALVLRSLKPLETKTMEEKA